MTHLDKQFVHRHVGDPVTIQATIEGLDAAQVTAARWTCINEAGTPVTKTLGSGITKSGTVPAVLDIAVDKADTDTLGEGVHDWQLAAGSTNPPVVAFGALQLDERL